MSGVFNKKSQKIIVGTQLLSDAEKDALGADFMRYPYILEHEKIPSISIRMNGVSNS